MAKRYSCDSERCKGRLYRILGTNFYTCNNSKCKRGVFKREELIKKYGEDFVRDVDEQSELRPDAFSGLEGEVEDRLFEHYIERIRRDGSIGGRRF